MRTLIFLLLIFCCHKILAQQVITTSGGTFSKSGSIIAFTIGESVAQTLNQGDKSLTQGFHQTTIVISSLDEVKDMDFPIIVFPNPVSDELTLRLSLANVTGFIYLLFDINGKPLIQNELESSETRVPISQLPNGIYIIRVLDGITEIKSFKIIKK